MTMMCVCVCVCARACVCVCVSDPARSLHRYRLFGFWKDIFLSRESIDRHTKTLNYEIEVKTVSKKSVTCYHGCR